MSLYIDKKSLEDGWLEKNGTHVKSVESYGKSQDLKFEACPDNSFWVCKVDCGAYWAAKVMDIKQVFVNSSYREERKKEWFQVEKKLLKEVCPKWDFYVKEEPEVEAGITWQERWKMLWGNDK